jgi:hypothetical protein
LARLDLFPFLPRVGMVKRSRVFVRRVAKIEGRGRG